MYTYYITFHSHHSYVYRGVKFQMENYWVEIESEFGREKKDNYNVDGTKKINHSAKSIAEFYFRNQYWNIFRYPDPFDEKLYPKGCLFKITDKEYLELVEKRINFTKRNKLIYG